MHEPAAKDKGFSAALALAYIGPAGLAPLQAAAADPGARCRLNAIRALGDMGTNALPAIPLLIQCLTNTNLDVARTATYALCELRLEPDLVLPALANCLRSPDPNTRIKAASWLAEVEAYRPEAQHVLLDARKDTAKEVRSFAEGVIIDTMPEEIIAVPPP
jgi:HEAT repeat protein